MGKLCEDQLIGKLVPLLRGVDSDKFDDAVAQAKNQLTAEQKQPKRNDFEKLFDAQIATLKDQGTSDQIVEIFQNQKDAVLKRASEMTFGDGNTPFLPVILLMVMVRNAGKVSYTYLDPMDISDVADALQKPCYIYDIEYGNSTRGKSPENAEKILK